MRTSTITLFASALALAMMLRGSHASITDCGGANALFKITKLEFYPDKLAPGENATLTLLYTAPEEIDGGTATTSVTLNFIPFTPTTENLCAVANDLSAQHRPYQMPECPITVGDHDGSSVATMPEGVSGTIVSKVEWRDLKDRLLLCIQARFSSTRGLLGAAMSSIFG
jgi:hypothetical protein